MRAEPVRLPEMRNQLLNRPAAISRPKECISTSDAVLWAGAIPVATFGGTVSDHDHFADSAAVAEMANATMAVTRDAVFTSNEN